MEDVIIGVRAETGLEGSSCPQSHAQSAYRTGKKKSTLPLN